MDWTKTQKTASAQRAGMFLLFFVCGLAVFLISLAFDKKIANNVQVMLRLAMAAIFLAAALSLRRAGHDQHGLVFHAFFVATVALFISWELSGLPLKWLALTVTTPKGCALANITERFLWVVPIILLVKLGRGDLASLYLKKGNLKKGLTIGLLGFAFFFFTAFFAAKYLFKAQDLTAAKVIAWAPWILLFVLSNAAGEEVLFRGLFLKRYEALFRPRSANILAALIFTFTHMQVNYSADVLVFMAIVFPLALVLGWLMQKSEGIWGSIFIHAGADIPVMLGIFSHFS